MKIKYEFANETVEIEVSDNWGDILIDLDRQEYNIDHKETRRHCSLDAYNLDDALLPSDEDIVRDYMKKEDSQRLYDAIEQLAPRQQALIYQVFFDERRVSEIAREEGITEAGIRSRLKKIYVKLKKSLS